MKVGKLIERAASMGLQLEPMLTGGFYLLDPNRHKHRFGSADEIRSDIDYYQNHGRLPSDAKSRS